MKNRQSETISTFLSNGLLKPADLGLGSPFVALTGTSKIPNLLMPEDDHKVLISGRNMHRMQTGGKSIVQLDPM